MPLFNLKIKKKSDFWHDLIDFKGIVFKIQLIEDT